MNWNSSTYWQSRDSTGLQELSLVLALGCAQHGCKQKGISTSPLAVCSCKRQGHCLCTLEDATFVSVELLMFPESMCFWTSLSLHI